MNCPQCGRELAEANRAASISGSVMGDEYTDVYWLCPDCDVYTVAHWRDNFTGEETVFTSGPLSRLQGDAIVGEIQRCDFPWDKHCRCEVHRKHFNDALD